MNKGIFLELAEGDTPMNHYRKWKRKNMYIEANCLEAAINADLR
jgi:hypothetical protein